MALEGVNTSGNTIVNEDLFDINRIYIKKSKVVGTDIRGSMLFNSNCTIESSNIINSNIKRIRGFSMCISKTNLSGVTFSNSAFLSGELLNSECCSVSINKITFNDLVIKNTYIYKSKLSDLIVKSGTWSRLYLRESKVKNCVFNAVNFSRSKFEGCTFENVQFNECIFDEDCYFEEIKFVNCTFNGVPLESIDQLKNTP